MAGALVEAIMLADMKYGYTPLYSTYGQLSACTDYSACTHLYAYATVIIETKEAALPMSFDVFLLVCSLKLRQSFLPASAKNVPTKLYNSNGKSVVDLWNSNVRKLQTA